jgi:hypothetical protein
MVEGGLGPTLVMNHDERGRWVWEIEAEEKISIRLK